MTNSIYLVRIYTHGRVKFGTLSYIVLYYFEHERSHDLLSLAWWDVTAFLDNITLLFLLIFPPVCIRSAGLSVGSYLRDPPCKPTAPWEKTEVIFYQVKICSLMCSPSPFSSSLKTCQWAPQAPEQRPSFAFEKCGSRLMPASLVPCGPSHCQKTPKLWRWHQSRGHVLINRAHWKRSLFRSN